MVKVYNIKEMVEKESEGKFTARESLAIIEGRKGIIVTDCEAVHEVYKSEDEKYNIALYPNDGAMHLFPSAEVNLTLRFIKEKGKYQECELTEFVRHFGSRIECNYNLLLKSIKQIGLTPDNYKREVEHA